MICGLDGSRKTRVLIMWLCSCFQDESAMEPSDSFSENVKRFDLEFAGSLLGLLSRINDKPCPNSSDKILSLANRLNYNSFYKMEFLCAKDSMGTTANGGAGDRGHSLNKNGK